ncbi:MAG: hypothetical protein ACJA2S_004435 [Cyclobacteriaceae bacterium]|jgi:hypothetical protein
MAFEMLAFLAIGVWVGHKLDMYFQLEFPAFLLSLSVIATVGSMIHMIRKLPKD